MVFSKRREKPQQCLKTSFGKSSSRPPLNKNCCQKCYRMTLLSQRDARIYFHLKFSFERFLSKYTHTHGGALFKRRNFLQIWKKTIVFFPLIQLCRLFSPLASSSALQSKGCCCCLPKLYQRRSESNRVQTLSKSAACVAF